MEMVETVWGKGVVFNRALPGLNLLEVYTKTLSGSGGCQDLFDNKCIRHAWITNDHFGLVLV